MIVSSDNLILAFHKGGKGSIKDVVISEVIKLYTFGKYSHVELIFPDWVLEGNGQKNKWFSSRGMDDPRGVAFKNIKMSHPERWDLFELTRDRSSIIESYYAALRLVGSDYDLKGILSYFGPLWTIRKALNRRRDVQEDWWCSEVVAFVLGLSDYKLSPVELFKVYKAGLV